MATKPAASAAQCRNGRSQWQKSCSRTIGANGMRRLKTPHTRRYRLCPLRGPGHKSADVSMRQPAYNVRFCSRYRLLAGSLQPP
jgi:hypothetical protein